MSTENENANENDVLDSIKKIEKAIKAKVLIQQIAKLKKLAKEINVMREKTTVTLDSLGLSERDIKRVIDFINEQSDVKLTKRQKDDIRDEIEDEINEERRNEEENVENNNVFDVLKGINLSGTQFIYDNAGTDLNWSILDGDCHTYDNRRQHYTDGVTLLCSGTSSHDSEELKIHL